MNDCVLRNLVVAVGHSLHHTHYVGFKVLNANRSKDFLHAFSGLKSLERIVLLFHELEVPRCQRGVQAREASAQLGLVLLRGLKGFRSILKAPIAPLRHLPVVPKCREEVRFSSSQDQVQ